MRIAIQIRELVSSNINTLVETAGNPVKVLRLLQSELQEGLIALQGDLSRSTRRSERLAETAATLVTRADDWTEKARVARDHKREDLARSALLAREQARTEAEQARADAASAAEEADEIRQVMQQLEAKLSETRARIDSELQRQQSAAAMATASQPATRGERLMDRIEGLEKRAEFAADGRREGPAPTAVDDQIEQLRREALVREELAAMKQASAATKAPRKTKARR